MKWHPADEAQNTLEVIKDLKLDPGLGYKIKICRDRSVMTPPMPQNTSAHTFTTASFTSSYANERSKGTCREDEQDKEDRVQKRKGKRRSRQRRLRQTQNICLNQNIGLNQLHPQQMIKFCSWLQLWIQQETMSRKRNPPSLLRSKMKVSLGSQKLVLDAACKLAKDNTTWQWP